MCSRSMKEPSFRYLTTHHARTVLFPLELTITLIYPRKVYSTLTKNATPTTKM